MVDLNKHVLCVKCKFVDNFNSRGNVEFYAILIVTTIDWSQANRCCFFFNYFDLMLFTIFNEHQSANLNMKISCCNQSLDVNDHKYPP